MAVKKIEELNVHRDVNSTEQFDVQDYLNENWDKMQDVVDNNAEELTQVQKDISTLKEDNKTNKSSIDVLEKSNETRDGKISKNTEDIEAIQRSIKAATETINKKDNETKQGISNNIFEIYNSKKEKIGNFTTDENGRIEISNLYQDLYYAKEIKSNENYVLNHENECVTYYYHPKALQKHEINNRVI